MLMCVGGNPCHREEPLIRVGDDAMVVVTDSPDHISPNKLNLGVCYCCDVTFMTLVTPGAHHIITVQGFYIITTADPHLTPAATGADTWPLLGQQGSEATH